jgi:hypothetical protein
VSDDTELTDAKCDAIADQVSPRMAAATEFQRIRQRALIRAGHAAALREDRGTEPVAPFRGTKVTVQGWHRHHNVEFGYDAYERVVAFLCNLDAAPIPED